MEYLFEIADTVIEIWIPVKLEMEDSYEKFLVKNKTPHAIIRFQTWQDGLNCDVVAKVYQGGVGVYQGKTGYALLERSSETREPYFYMPLKENMREQVCYVRKEEWWRFTHIHQVFQVIAWERILNRNGVFLLHASFIEWKQRGILFSAPSGTGKSTQAELWKQYEGARIINGDRAAITIKDGTWRCYGLPLAGSSQIFVNESYGVGAVVVLRQGEENRLKRLKPIEAFQWIYSETIVQYWDKVFQDILIELLEAFVTNIPVYMLECTPDQTAVAILKNELEGEMDSDTDGTTISEKIT